MLVTLSPGLLEPVTASFYDGLNLILWGLLLGVAVLVQCFEPRFRARENREQEAEANTDAAKRDQAGM